MSFSTVGELIDALKDFDRSTPVLKNIPDMGLSSGAQYTDIELTSQLKFRVRPETYADGYCDCDELDTKGFDAIIL